jgi:hypothetical protein
MALNTFKNYYGEVVNGLKIIGIFGRDRSQAPIWQAICTKCGTTGQTFEHRFLVDGSARCKSGICGKPTVTESRKQAVGAAQGIRARDVRARSAFNASDAPSRSVRDEDRGLTKSDWGM